jgi:hypothetical protein
VLGNPLKYLDPSGEETQLVFGQQTPDNVFGHIALAVDGVAYSYGTSWVNDNGDWGVSLNSYLAAQTERETELLTLNLTPEQEDQLLQTLETQNPYEGGEYYLLSHSCVTVCESALEGVGALSNQAGPVIISQAGNELQAGAPKSFTPGELAARARGEGLVTATQTVGVEKVTKAQALLGTIKTFFTRLIQ